MNLDISELTRLYRPRREDETGHQYAINLFPRWIEFQEESAAHYDRFMRNRFHAMLDEINHLESPSAEDVAKILHKHWPSGIEIYLEALPTVPQEFMLYYVCFGAEMASLMLLAIRTGFQNITDITDIKETLTRYVSKAI